MSEGKNEIKKYKLFVLKGREESERIEKAVEEFIEEYLSKGYLKSVVLKVIVVRDRSELSEFGAEKAPAMYVEEEGRWYYGFRDIYDYFFDIERLKKLPILAKAICYG